MKSHPTSNGGMIITDRTNITIINVFKLFLILSTIISTAAAIEPVALGQGRMDKTINLDIGSSHSSATPYFGSRGFAPPLVPQPMELDPGAMVSQSGRLRDQSEALRDQSAAIYNETADLLNRTKVIAKDVDSSRARVEVLEKDAGMSANDARINANASLQSALLAKDYLSNTRAVYDESMLVYNKTWDTAREVEALSRRADMAEMRINMSVSEILNSTPSNTEDIESLQQEVSSLTQRLTVLERKISDLENRTGALGNPRI